MPIQVFQVNAKSNKYVVVKGETAKVVYKDKLEKEVATAQERITEIAKTQITDEELLEWARLNYPVTDFSTEKGMLEELVKESTEILSEMK